MSAPFFGLCLTLLLVGHALGDGLMQPAWLSAAKRVGGDATLAWPAALGGHAAIHGLLAGDMVAIAGAPAKLAVAIVFAEAAAHGLSDFAKCRGAIGTVTDQALHLLCKLVWALLAAGATG